VIAEIHIENLPIPVHIVNIKHIKDENFILLSGLRKDLDIQSVGIFIDISLLSDKQDRRLYAYFNFFSQSIKIPF
jgi:hypothetical protein